MHLIVRDFPDDLVELLKARTGSAAASKAVVTACYASISQADQIERQRLRIAELETALRVSRQVVEGARSAAALLLEHTAQGDLLTRARYQPAHPGRARSRFLISKPPCFSVMHSRVRAGEAPSHHPRPKGD
ncbi:hypothetical protein [Pseudomonas sp. KNUC1026]|uniref:hypothetical protein n=1 Tax=Pseudomonas sp. KNUC1026 TaxID=2893890 RepID=UPI001F19B2E4|nr:hypothetical protein [Pseudomonas sp. KNUC1026]UFH51160.1 hypothetical protein LN139_09045 [Pseudomonas sp. KNUC1026]